MQAVLKDAHDAAQAAARANASVPMTSSQIRSTSSLPSLRALLLISWDVYFALILAVKIGTIHSPTVLDVVRRKVLGGGGEELDPDCADCRERNQRALP